MKKGSFDEYVYIYCANRFYAYSARYVHAIEAEEVSAREKADYVSGLKKQILRIPDHEIMYRTIPELFAVVELNMVPAPRLNTDLSICKDEVSDWMTFLAAYDRRFGNAPKDKLKTLLEAYLNKRLKTGTSIDTLKNEMHQLRSRVRGLKAKSDFNNIANKALKRIIPT